MPGALYLLPVGLGDGAWEAFLPARTRDIACSLHHFVVENAKTARIELKRISHPVPLHDLKIEQLPERITPADLDRLLAPLAADQDMGLMSEAGCPGVADPGALLVRRAHEKGWTVRPLVGPSSLLLALMASGLDGQHFAFHGYLPVREPERGQRIKMLEKESARLGQTQMFIETPYRNMTLFQAILAACRESTRLCVATDLTRTTETVVTRPVGQWKKYAPPELERRPTVFLLLS
ncbi:MAG TPA: SAM-dependent methyltransferase [Rhodocyclaceae bacterium]|nr:SAM-dependent methyltransferase [Rhodocyclaceae bacterium]